METPFRTIQAAIAAAPTLSRVSDDSIDQRTIIFVEQGEYTADDATEVDGVKYVAYAKLKRILVVGSGAETCVIRGAADSSVATDASPYGCGSDAVKCIGSANTAIACFRGFTIADGRGVAYDSGSDWGGAIAGGGKNYTFLCDCVVTNCVGNRGVVSSARMDRCLVVDCRDYYCTLRSAIAQNCVFEATESKYAPRDGFIGQDAEAYGCTFASRFNGQASFANSGAATIFNSIVSQGKNASVNHKTDGNVYWDMNSYAGTGYVQVDPAFVNKGSGDYRLLSLSGAIGNGSTTNAYWKFAGADVEGRMPLVANGRLTPGAVQKTVAAVVVARPSSGTLTNVGTNAVEAGESITVSYTAGSRPMAGIVVDGVTNSASAYSFTYTASADGNPVAAVSIQAAISPHWYVDPDGDDGNDGWTPETAKGTLKGVMTVSGLMSGDTVHAAAGSYTNKVMASPVGELAVRVVVPEGVALVADEGPESTFIVGEKDTSATAASGRDGCGTNAVRCVYLRNDSTLRGFTVCGGRVYGYNNNLIDDNIAGGILCQSFGSSVSSPVVYDCIISNNWGRCGAGSYGGRYVGCRFLENHGYSGEAASRYSSLYGCYLDRNYGAPTFGIYYALENCTFGPDNLTLAGDRSTGLYVCQQPLSSAIAKNCVFLDRVRRNDSNAVVATNSVFRSDDNSYSPIESQRLGCSLMTTNEMLFAAGWIPSRMSPLTDAADETLMSDYAKKMDATGGRRTSNGLSDIGAFEHDWREDYATRLGGSRVRVDDASEDVVMDKAMTALKIGPGGTLSLTLLAGTTTVATRYTLPFEVLGEGSLEVTVNGLPAGVFATGEGSVEFKNALSANSVAFAYTANDGDDGVLLDTVSSRCNAMSIIVR